MRNTVTVAVCLSLHLFAAAAVCAAELPDTIDKVRGSIVGVGTFQATRRPPGNFGGTGFVAGDGRYVVTNSHTVPQSLDRANREVLSVFVPGARVERRRAELVKRDAAHDLALLRFEGEPLPTMQIGSAEKVREGEIYAFTGFPIGMVIGMRPVTHRGIVSAITPIAIPQIGSNVLSAQMIAMLRNPYDVFQLDATAYPGNSGSPLYDPATGAVIGVINMVHVKRSKEAILSDPSGITYAIPARYVRELLDGVDE